MFNSPGLTQRKSFTVNPTVVVPRTLLQHSIESDAIDAELARSAVIPTGYKHKGFANRARQLIAAARGNEWSEFSVY